MSLSTLGRRYERLLFFAGPLSLGAFLTLFVVFATATQYERSTARCYESAARLLEGKGDQAEAIWKEFRASKKSSGMADIDYTFRMRKLVIDTALEPSCYGMLVEEVESRAKNGPNALIDGLHKDARRLASTPIKYPGVEIPERATIGLMGTSISIELVLFSALLQILLGPLLLLWLGSLYTTRYRETLLIEKAKSVTDVFPHLVNIYPVGRYPAARRRSYMLAYLPHVFAFAYGMVRIGLLTMFIGPAVGAYIAGVFLVETSAYSLVMVVLAVMVAIFAAVLVIGELLPWHYNRTFPGPIIGERS
jgi:hypothetical protein